MLGLIAGVVMWAFVGGMWSMLFGDDLFLLAHHGGRGAADGAVDY